VLVTVRIGAMGYFTHIMSLIQLYCIIRLAHPTPTHTYRENTRCRGGVVKVSLLYCLFDLRYVSQFLQSFTPPLLCYWHRRTQYSIPVCPGIVYCMESVLAS
jgi:hypothetical protein